MTTFDTWYEKLTDSRNDWELRLIFADWLEDQGEPVLAAGQRWQAAQHKRPIWIHTLHSYWYDASNCDKLWGDPFSNLPGPVFQLLAGGDLIEVMGWGFCKRRYTPNGMQAEADLAQALAKMEQELVMHDHH